MAYGTTSAQLIANVRHRLNLESSQYASDNTILLYLNEGLSELDDIMVTRYEDYKLTAFQSFIQVNQNTFPVPSDMLKVREVEVQFGSRWITLKPFSLQQKNKWNYPVLHYPSSNVNLEYRLEGESIEIIPGVSAPGTYQVWYIPQFTLLQNTTDAILQPYMDTQAWCSYGITDACMKIVQSQGLTDEAALFLQQKQMLQKRIETAAKDRDAGMPKHTINTRAMNRYYRGSGRLS